MITPTRHQRRMDQLVGVTLRTGGVLGLGLLFLTLGPSFPAQAQQDEQQRTVTVNLRGLEIDMPARVPAGSVRFRVHNTGDRTHAFEIEGQGIHEATRQLRPGQTATLQVDLRPGTYYVYCPVADHEQRGMNRSITAVRRQQGQQRQQGQRRQHQSDLRPISERITGQLEELREVQVALAPQDHTVVRFELDDGRIVFADLGPRLTFEQLALEEGDAVTLAGQRRWIDGTPLFEVARISGAGQVWEVRQQQGAADGSRAADGRTRTLEGRILGFQHVGVRTGGQHVLVKLATDQGRAAIADLGEHDHLEGLGLEKGDRVSLRGQWLWIDGHLVFWSQRLSGAGQTEPVRLQR